MKKRLNKNTIATITLAALLATTLVLPAIAATAPLVTKTISAKFGVSILLDDVPFTPKDAKGNVVPAIIIDGTTYLTVRALAEATGNTVRWDGENNAVRIYTAENGDWTLVDNAFMRGKTVSSYQYQYTSDKEALKKNSGQDYQTGFVYSGEEAGDLWFMSSVDMSLNKKYSQIKFDLSILYNAPMDDALSLVIRESGGGGIVYKTQEITVGTQSIEADISGAEKIVIEIKDANNLNHQPESRQITMGDMKLR